MWRKFGDVSLGSVVGNALWTNFEKASLTSVVKRILWSRIVEASLGIFRGAVCGESLGKFL